eukprot:10608673-Lingulodinium_polyedra.AAC.1
MGPPGRRPRRTPRAAAATGERPCAAWPTQATPSRACRRRLRLQRTAVRIAQQRACRLREAMPWLAGPAL